MATRKLIALYSPIMGSGKSVVAGTLQLCLGYSLVKFAGPLKDMVRALLAGMGFDNRTRERMVEGDLKENPVPGLGGTTPRMLMQTLGTEWGRKAVEDGLWVNIALSKAASLRDNDVPVVIDDLRFPNEYAALRAAGATIIKVTRPGITANSTHGSEGLLDGHYFDLELVNDGTVRDLQQRALSAAANPR